MYSGRFRKRKKIVKEKTTAAARESVSEREEKTGEDCKENRKKREK